MLATWSTASFIDLDTFPDVLRAHRHHTRRLRNSPDAMDALAYAKAVVWSWQTAAWPEKSIWPQRTAALAGLLGLRNRHEVAAHPLIPYPETVAVAALLAAPAWRHHVLHTSPGARTRASPQAVTAIHTELARRTDRPWLPRRMPGPTSPGGRRALPPDPLRQWLDNCVRTRAGSTPTARAELWTLPRFAQAPEHYSDRSGFLHHGARPSDIRARDLGLTGGWQAPSGRSAPA